MVPAPLSLVFSLAPRSRGCRRTLGAAPPAPAPTPTQPGPRYSVLCCTVCLDLPKASVYQVLTSQGQAWGSVSARGDAQLKSLLLYLGGSLLPLEGRAHSLCTSLNGTTRALRMCLWNQRPAVRVRMDSRHGHVAHRQCLGLRSAGSQRKGACLLLTQCTNGHLMCAGCFIHLLADARLKEEQATCPNCRCEISKSLCCRNLAVEKAVSELPSECGFCLRQFPRSLLERHQKEECQDRVTQCKYKRIGCPWHGPFHELTVHEAACAHPTKTGNELMEILDEMDQSHRKEMQLYNSIFSLLSFEKIGYTEVQFRPYRTDDFITRLYYETPRFTVLNQTWVLKARVNDSERNPNLSCKRTLSFQLLLKSKVTAPLECSFLLLKGPYDDVKISPVIYHFVFTNESNETDYVPLPIVDSVECNKLLAAKNINLRLFLFQIQK
ncbi:cysteine and histidine-rich protein 1 [Leptonychotes weddellii]|uniref:Cysteine and histidine-rich protein 1 n=1 Tax=Leptonychotes weddellii TaxID=9713 RepID=A0A7F8RUF0_LEPWE|nr:cysteine and histidine-rich protein 1 [Leptonychotes weddellii]